MKVQKILLPIIAIIGALVFFSVFIIKEVNQAIVLQFGDPKRIIVEPGLNFKIPFIQNVVYLDKRILNLDTPPAEVIASDQKRLIVDAFARFKIIDPLKFYISVGNERVARSRLATIINSRIRNVLGQQELQTLLSKDRSKQMSLIQVGVNAEAQKFGIEIVDVRIKRADLPQANSEAIFRRMQTEREREAKEFRARGAEMAVTITSTADKEVSVILANANKDSEIMKELIIVFGLFLFIEGILYAIFPSKMKSMLKKLELVNESQLRTGGLVFAIIGFIIIYYING